MASFWGRDARLTGHVDDGAADEHAEILPDVFNVEGEEVGQDEEEDANGRELDEEGDDGHDDLLDFADGAQNRGVGTFDKTADHDG